MGQQLVVTEGVYSMDGDSAPLAEIQHIARRHHAWLLVDDAHGIGVTGDEGRGTCWLRGVKPELLVVTFGKGFGVSGAAVLCSEKRRRLSAAIRPSSGLQHQYAARPGARR
ncbi:8-amino-7-oxononanoate synthase [Salmonella enterica subsp. enterica]|uniref:8-amino-7-oxononanoate synthase n=1 Tax=Salmonella enterica I TaxID=59201 RepID=A0A447U728_SALET|nr:8-amino-7-oxononanoate synthase [Salmonella enterica subsp. enterica]